MQDDLKPKKDDLKPKKYLKYESRGVCQGFYILNHILRRDVFIVLKFENDTFMLKYLRTTSSLYYAIQNQNESKCNTNDAIKNRI